MTNKEKNKKLLEWAGFLKSLKEGYVVMPHSVDLCPTSDFYSPDTGLRDIFKWLVPKYCYVTKGAITLNIEYNEGKLQYSVELYDKYLYLNQEYVASEPQVALADAIYSFVENK
jgi:hypothetical protein